MAGANLNPSSGVSGGMGAIFRGYREEQARQFNNAGGGGGGSGDLDVAKLNWGQRRWLMKNQGALDARRDSQRQAENEDLRYRAVIDDTMRTRDTARTIAADTAAKKTTGSQERSKMKLESKLQQGAATSQRIYEESTKDTAFQREQRGLNAAARREKASRNQAFSFGGGAPVESVSFGGGAGGGKKGGVGGGDTIKFSVT